MRSLEDMKSITTGIADVCGHPGKGGARLFGSRKVMFFTDFGSAVNAEGGAA